MNVGGLNKMGFFPQAKSAKGNPSEKGEASSFEDVLAQTDRSDDKGEVEAAAVESPKTPIGRPQVTKTKAAGERSVEADAMPTTPSAPSFESPMLNDKLMGAPTAPAMVPVAAKQPMNAVAQEGDVDTLTRRVVWSDFLRKMKDELGVSAEDVLGAFQSLSEEELAQPPAQTVDKVVMALGLEGQDAQMAKQYFMDLINKTKPNSLGEELATSNKQISLTLMSQREMSRRNDSRAVDRMQQKFFMNGAFARPQDAVAANPNGQAQYIPKAVMDANGNVSYVNEQPQVQQQTDSQAPFAPVPMTPAHAPAPAAGPASAAPSAQPMNEAVAQMKPVESAKQTSDVDALVKKFMSGQAQSSRMSAAAAAPAAVQAPAVPMANLTASAPAASAAAAASAASATRMMPALPNIESSGGDEGDYSEYTSDAAYLGALAGTEQGLQNAGPSDFQSQLNNIGQGAQPMPVSDVVQQAQVMVRDGGGEMKVTLAPDGLGEVAMRVSVKDGKVNVQMITESDEAKKLIERQLGDLKTSLTTQNLQVDGIKVDTATNIGKQMEQQYQDAQRQMAQQTLEQFRQDHQGWRHSFFDQPALKVYKGQSEAPRDIPAPSANSRKAGNRRLDLVA